VRRRYPAEHRDGKPCQRPGCLNQGRLRAQSGAKKKGRSIYLCASCLDSLRADQLNDLFLQFAGGVALAATSSKRKTTRCP
jgi:hypothetical protein